MTFFECLMIVTTAAFVIGLFIFAFGWLADHGPDWLYGALAIALIILAITAGVWAATRSYTI